MKLQLRNLSKKFNDKIAVNHFDAEIDSNECIALIGPNGAGKTTLIKLITGVLSPDTGECLLDNLKPSEYKKKIGYLPQEPKFYEWMTVEENLKFLGGLSDISSKEIKSRIKKALKIVSLDGLENKTVGKMSGGMKQRLGIAQATLHEPEFVILDEPVSALDPAGRRDIIDLIKTIKSNCSVIISTHILSDAEEFADRFFIMKEGSLISDLSKEKIKSSKYRNSISLELFNYREDLVDIFLKHSFVKKCIVKDGKLIIQCKQLSSNKFNLLKIIESEKIDFRKINYYEENLEEVFLEMTVAHE